MTVLKAVETCDRIQACRREIDPIGDDVTGNDIYTQFAMHNERVFTVREVHRVAEVIYQSAVVPQRPCPHGKQSDAPTDIRHTAGGHPRAEQREMETDPAYIAQLRIHKRGRILPRKLAQSGC